MEKQLYGNFLCDVRIDNLLAKIMLLKQQCDPVLTEELNDKYASIRSTNF